MNLFFVVDEYTDVEPEPVVREMVDIVLDAIRNPYKPRPEGEIVLGRVAQELVFCTLHCLFISALPK
jgi:Delta6-protoilludene synthase